MSQQVVSEQPSVRIDRLSIAGVQESWRDSVMEFLSLIPELASATVETRPMSDDDSLRVINIDFGEIYHVVDMATWINAVLNILTQGLVSDGLATDEQVATITVVAYIQSAGAPKVDRMITLANDGEVKDEPFVR